MGFIVYIDNHCAACVKVSDYVTKNNIDCIIVNVDTTPEKHPPINVFIYPALFEGSKLLAYGTDIIKKLVA